MNRSNHFVYGHNMARGSNNNKEPFSMPHNDKNPPKDTPPPAAPAGGVLPKKPKPKGPTPVGATVSRNKKQATGPYATS